LRIVRLAVAVAAAVAACVLAEGAVRVIDGYALTAMRLASTNPSRRAQTSETGKWLEPNQGAPYVATLPVADGVDRGWFALMGAPLGK
jgi:hypothetical protein